MKEKRLAPRSDASSRARKRQKAALTRDRVPFTCASAMGTVVVSKSARKRLLAEAESVVLRRRRSELRDCPLEERRAPRRIEGRLQADLGVERLSRIDADATPLEAGDSRPAKLLGCHEASRDLVPLLRVFVHLERAVPDRVLRFREAVQPRARRVDPNDPLGDVVDAERRRCRACRGAPRPKPRRRAACSSSKPS